MSDKPVRPPKRQYVRPRLVTYGNLLLLTQNRIFGSRKDGGKGFKGRTP